VLYRYAPGVTTPFKTRVRARFIAAPAPLSSPSLSRTCQARPFAVYRYCHRMAEGTPDSFTGLANSQAAGERL